MSVVATAPPRREAVSYFTKSVVGTVVAAAVALAIKLQPQIGQLDPTGQSALAVMVFAVGLWVADALNAGITAVLALGLLIIAGVPSNVALGGFAGGAFWILVSVLFFGTAMDKTGLARRISYRILLVVPPTYAGVSLAFLLIGFVLTLGVPSMTVRTAIMVPIAVALVHAIKLPMPGTGAALIVLGAFEMAVLPGCAVLTGSLWGPFVAGLFSNTGLPITWIDYARVMALPTVIWCALVVAANVMVMRPPPASGMSRNVVRDEMEKLGPMSAAEIKTAAIIAASVLAWAVQPWHRVPPDAIGMVALAALFATRTLVASEIGTGIPWALAIFVGGMLSLTTVMSTYKINVWLGSYIVPTVQPFVDNPYLLVVVISLAVAAMRLVDPVGFITIAAFFLPLAKFVADRGVPPLVLTAMILLPAHVFWFSYQNIWIAMTDGISGNDVDRAYTGADRIKLASVYFGVTIAALWIAVVY